MIRTLAFIALALATSPVMAAAPCYDLGHAGHCPRLLSVHRATAAAAPASQAECSGWRDDHGACRHGLGGSGMGSRGYVGRCGGRTC